MKSLFFSLIFICSIAQAETIQCRLEHNLDHIEDVRVDVISGSEKKVIFNNDLVTAYLKAKESGMFEIEAYLPTHQMRIYSQGALTKATDLLVLTSWSREMIIDIICSLHQP